jgi:hypothetical protein
MLIQCTLVSVDGSSAMNQNVEDNNQHSMEVDFRKFFGNQTTL